MACFFAGIFSPDHGAGGAGRTVSDNPARVVRPVCTAVASPPPSQRRARGRRWHAVIGGGERDQMQAATMVAASPWRTPYRGAGRRGRRMGGVWTAPAVCPPRPRGRWGLCECPQ